ncbi:LysR substrate-binding domain-containing protein [Paraferrimonas sedimenticola]|uniref:Transcriptional regulator n=1 Tax=Paraferrimonas sedimenticola TaxID=375674 RepID=A0AA37RWQ3_9GAMM|nr:LysR substrate-binding domain-containing protein [Paraferrimonas sedimenticola]GLP96678.1 transcriptional regulator [Paraferrimonas sedimenticola]
MAVFCHVVDAGSLTGAAQQLGMSASAISQQVTQLEEDLGISLIYRSTRKISLSEAGKRYYQHGKRMMNAAECANDEIVSAKDSIEGEIRISAFVGIAAWVLGDLLRACLDEHPQLKFNITATDAGCDLIMQQIDIAIGVGQPQKSDYIYHRLGTMGIGLYASPSYLETYGVPKIPDDLNNHHWIGHNESAEKDNLNPLSDVLLSDSKGKTRLVQPSYRVKSNDLNTLIGQTLAGLGLCALPEMEVNALSHRGGLTRVLPDWTIEPRPIYALTVDRKLPNKVKVLLDALKQYFERL